jgi:D-glycero-alpha-D-manno-heptose 1-phosphate guanylyltransferase
MGTCEPVGILLAGGKGTRLRDRHPDLPKPLIPCRGRPFIEWVIGYFASHGVGKFVVSLGHLAEVAEAYFREWRMDNVAIATVRESAPLGTGGAVRFAWDTISDSDVIVANGDSLVLADLAPAFALFARPEVDAVILGVHQDDAGRYGTLRVDPDGRLLAFEEKRPGAGLVNAGVYLLKARLRETIPPHTPLSMETDVIPRWLSDGRRVHVHPCRAPFLDIGTPESLDAAAEFLEASGLGFREGGFGSCRHRPNAVVSPAPGNV